MRILCFSAVLWTSSSYRQDTIRSRHLLKGPDSEDEVIKQETVDSDGQQSQDQTDGSVQSQSEDGGNVQHEVETSRPGAFVIEDEAPREDPRVALHRMWDAEGEQVKKKWEMRKQLHAVNQKLAQDFMKAALKVAGGKREGDPTIGDNDAGSTILRVARKDNAVKETEGQEVFTRPFAYVLNELWTAEHLMKVEEEISYMHDDELAILWIQGPTPWQAENLRMTLQAVHMFEEYGGWLSVSTAKKWKNRGSREAWPNGWLGGDLLEVMTKHYDFLTDEVIAQAMSTGEEDKVASFGTFTVHTMPRYYPTGYPRRKPECSAGCDTVTFLPSA